MERRFTETRDKPLPFVRLLILILLPAVFILTKIGESTIKRLLVVGYLSHVIFHASKRMVLRFPSVQLPSFQLSRLPQRPKPRSEKRPLIVYAVPFHLKARYFLLGASLATIVLIPLIIQLWLSQLPNPNQLAYREVPLSTKVYDRQGRFLFQFYANQNRTKVSLSEIPQHLIKATIAIEDKNFYKHNGFDAEAIVRATKETLINKNLQGGSTITQQLIKSTLLTPEVSIERKVKEIILAFLTERKFSKEQVLEMYFNQVSYGGTAWGVGAASETYFGKNVKDVTLSESALLAGLPGGPTLYSPFGARPELSIARQHEVLHRMVEEGYITREQAQEAKSQSLSFAQPGINIKAPHFIMYVKDWLARRYGIRMVEQGGLRVTTTLDLDLQEKAQEIVAEEIERLGRLSVNNGASLITNPQTGEILAMVGSRDYFDTRVDGNVNVTTSLRQPGSAIKVVTYAAALEKGLTAASLLDDSPITYSLAGSPPYSPVNYDGRFHGKVTLREAFGNSYNVPAVKTLAQIGLPAMIDMGRRMGITTWKDEGRFGLSLTLGGGEVRMLDMATVYGVLANDGKRKDLTPILKITNAQGEVLEEPKSQDRRVLSEGIAFILSDVLADNSARTSAFGPNSILAIPNYKVSVKTGTSDNKRDNWTIGFSKDRLVAVWVGNNDNGPMHPSLTSGITGAAPIWNRIMTTALADKPVGDLANIQPPAEIVAVPVCRINGLLPCGACPIRTEYFLLGTQPKLACRPEFLTPAPAVGGLDQSTSN